MVTKTQSRYATTAKVTKPALPKLKATVTQIEDVSPKPTQASIADDVKALFAKYSIAVPSSTRLYISYVAQFCVGLGIGYIGSIILETLVISAMMLSSSMFFGMTVYILGMLATLYAAWKAGGWVGDFIVSGDIDRSYQKYSSKVAGFFAFGNREVTA